MMTGRDRAFAKATELDRLPPGDLRDDLGAFLNAETCSFGHALRAAIEAAGDQVMTDPAKRDEARTASQGWLHTAAEQAEDDAAADFVDEAERIQALHAAHELMEVA